jgi:hypothetical protein
MVLLSVTVGTVCDSVAAPPSKPPPAPPAADIAYMSISNNAAGSMWLSAAIRGIAFDAEGQPSGDAEIWKADTRFTPAIAWDPDGRYVFWVQTIDRKGTRALMRAAPGAVPRVIFVFSSTSLRLGQMSDALVSGPGCGSTPVVYFWGIMSPTNRDTLWVLDPFASSPQPRELYRPDAPPPDDVGGSLQGLAISPLGRQLVFGAYSAELFSRAAVALPLACNSAASLPDAAGLPQPMFPARYDADKAWIQSFDWSRDGRRLVVAMGRWIEAPGGAYVYDPELWVADLNYVAADGAEQVSVASLAHVPSGAAAYPSWAPSAVTGNCDRLAFNRSGSIWLFDVPREGFRATECTRGVPGAIGGVAAAALDWK